MEELNRKLGAKARKQFLPLLIIGLIMLLVGGLLLVSAAVTSGDVKDLNTRTAAQLKTGSTYEIRDNNLIVGAYANDKSGEYFILYRQEDDKYMGLYVKGSDKTKAESIMEDNWKFFNDETDSLSAQSISVKGKLTSMTGDEKKYFQEWFTDSGWTLTEVNENVDYRTLNTDEDDLEMIIFGVILGLIGLGLTVYSLKQLVGGGYKKKLLSQMEARGLTADRVSSELDRAQSFKGVDLAQTFALVNGTKAEIVPYDELVWAYGTVHTTQHRIYGIIPAGKTVNYTVELVDRNKQHYTINCKNEEESNSVLAALGTLAPHIIKGYSDELKAVADNRFQEMIAEVDRRKAQG